MANVRSRFNPIVVDGVMYVQAKGSSIVALDPATGKELWERPNQGAVGARGINYWQSADRLRPPPGVSQRRDDRANQREDGRADYLIWRRTARSICATGLWTARSCGPTAADQQPGTHLSRTSTSSRCRPRARRTSRIPRDVQAYDILTGKLAWVFHTIPKPGEVGADTWPDGDARRRPAGVHNWSEFTVDEENGIVFIPVGTARYDFFGGNRAGNNLFANSLVALDAKTGRRLWHFQTIHHDLWDYDLPQSPKLLTIRQNGQPVRGGGAGQQAGIPVRVRAQDRACRVSDRGEAGAAVGSAGRALVANAADPDEGEAVRAAVVHREGCQSVPAEGRAGGDQREAARLSHGRHLYTRRACAAPCRRRVTTAAATGAAPRSIRSGASTTSSPRNRRPVLKAFTGAPNGAMGGAVQGATPAPAVPPADYNGLYRVPIDFWLTSMNLSAMGPPWSQLTAYDLNTGNIKWQVPNGTVAGLPEIPEWKGPTGAHWPRGGPLVTGGGLVFVATGSDRKFRAYDRDNGKVVWATDIPAASDGVPASFDVNGRAVHRHPGLGARIQPRARQRQDSADRDARNERLRRLRAAGGNEVDELGKFEVRSAKFEVVQLRPLLRTSHFAFRTFAESPMKIFAGIAVACAIAVSGAVMTAQGGGLRARRRSPTATGRTTTATSRRPLFAAQADHHRERCEPEKGWSTPIGAGNEVADRHRRRHVPPVRPPIVAVDAATAKEVWKYELTAPTPATTAFRPHQGPRGGESRRGSGA